MLTKPKVSNLLLFLFLFPLISKTGDSLFHHHHTHYCDHGCAAQLSDYHETCLVFQYELTVFSPHCKLPVLSVYVSVTSFVADKLLSYTGSSIPDLTNPRGPPLDSI